KIPLDIFPYGHVFFPHAARLYHLRRFQRCRRTSPPPNPPPPRSPRATRRCYRRQPRPRTALRLQTSPRPPQRRPRPRPPPRPPEALPHQCPSHPASPRMDPAIRALLATSTDSRRGTRGGETGILSRLCMASHSKEQT